jgi:GxxExxY protein
MPSADLNALATRTLDCAFKVHRALGPGLYESVYQAGLTHELRKKRIVVRCAVAVPLTYDDVSLECGLQLDRLVEKLIVIENKAVESIYPIHLAQLLTYLRLTKCELGYLINWNVPLLKNGIKRLVNNA